MSRAALIVATAIVVLGICVHILARNGSQQSLAGGIIVFGIFVAMVGGFLAAIGV